MRPGRGKKGVKDRGQIQDRKQRIKGQEGKEEESRKKEQKQDRKREQRITCRQGRERGLIKEE